MSGPADNTPIAKAIRHGVEAGKLRRFVRQHGGAGLCGLVRLAERHSSMSKAELEAALKDAKP